MKLPYTIYDPTHNRTALVTTPVPQARQADAASALMALRPDVEQVGFLEPPSASAARLGLRMMGGEFCGNASMAAACFLAETEGLGQGDEADYPLQVSGAEGLVRVHVVRTGSGFWGTVALPLPERLASVSLPAVGEVPAVFFPGIVHCVVPAGSMTRRAAERAVGPLCAALRADACGILLFDESAGAFAPLVYVAATGSAVWESGCGSGSAAIGCALALRDGTDCRRALRQPGGTIRVRAGWDGARISGLTITGEVCKADSGCLDFSLRPGRFTQQEAGVLAAKP